MQQDTKYAKLMLGYVAYWECLSPEITVLLLANQVVLQQGF